MKTIFNIIIKWLPPAIITAGVCGLVYLSAQQALRMGANDPQIQMMEIRISNIAKISGIAMLAIWAATLFIIALGELAGRKKSA
jgi:uncharacterized protein (DUF39 family)